VAFGYFESLFTLRDPTHLRHELIRIKSLSLLLDQVGQPEQLYGVFVDATADIFERTFAAIQNGERNEAFLVNAFNEEYKSNAVLTYFRVGLGNLSYRFLHTDSKSAFDQRMDEAQSSQLP
jgi:ubiquitin thioesterase protein OTUB1